jgi:predicted GH43/DUF377 family glycosyl hydrolase
MPKKKVIKKRIPSSIRTKKRTTKTSVQKKKVVKRKKVSSRVAHPGPKKSLLQKSENNPILSPIGEHPWESNQTFNPAAVLLDGKVHLVYRSIGNDGVSRFGYAASYDGVQIDERHPEPAFSLLLNTKEPKPHYVYASGDSWGGAEDPRMTPIDDLLYMLFTAIDEGGFPRVAMTAISKNDFLAKNWSWAASKIISPAGEVHKNWALFPEKINDKYAILHSVSPKITIEYLDDLDFEDKPYIKSFHEPVGIKGGWEKKMRGIGPSPLKTKYGWLVLYHASTDDSGYAMGAMLLDLKHPETVLARSAEPILEPEKWYEYYGWKGGIVYSCGAVIMGDDLLVYYGGADSVVCVAKANLEHFLKELMKDHKPKMTSVRRVLSAK